jgi:hypothetical protein
MAVAGNTFVLFDVGLHILTVVLHPSGTNGATPYMFSLYDETLGAPLASYHSDVSDAPSFDAIYNIPLNVTNNTHFYSFRITAYRGESGQYAMDLGGRPNIPTFQCTVMAFLSSGGGVIGNDIVRGYTYRTTPTFPPLPQAYPMLYQDSNLNVWVAFPGDTVWTEFNIVGT